MHWLWIGPSTLGLVVDKPHTLSQSGTQLRIGLPTGLEIWWQWVKEREGAAVALIAMVPRTVAINAAANLPLSRHTHTTSEVPLMRGALILAYNTHLNFLRLVLGWKGASYL